MKQSGRLVLASLSVLLLVGLLVVSCSHRKPPARPNVVLVIVDTLRPDFLSCYGYDRPTSPNIDRLAAEGVLFETAITEASWTKPAFASMLTSLYPFQHGALTWSSAMADTISTLAEVLGGAGYSSTAVINFLGLTGRHMVTKGFDVESTSKNAPGAVLARRRRDAAETSTDAIKLMQEASKPFFVLIHYFDLHDPLLPAEEFLEPIEKPGDPDIFSTVAGADQSEAEKSTEKGLARRRLRYATCLRGIDDAIGKILVFLDDSGLARKTVVIVTGDHGESFMEHGLLSHGNSVYDEEIKVPLIIRYPDVIKPGRRISRQVRHIDIFPTVVDFAGVADGAHREGMDLAPLIGQGRVPDERGKFLPSDVDLAVSTMLVTPDLECLRTLNCKLILEPATGLMQFYDLRRDPGETVNLWPQGGRMADSLRGLLGRVPGSSLGAWRLCFGGMPGATSVEATVRAGRGSRIAFAKGLASRSPITIEIGPDSTELKLAATPKDLLMVGFETEPAGGPVEVTLSFRGKDAPAAIRVGADGSRALGKSFVATREDCLGPPRDFSELRDSDNPWACLWWLPGEKLTSGGHQVKLTPEETRRLRALGYVQ